MHWRIAADHFGGPGSTWIDDFVPPTAGLTFEKVPPPERGASWHNQKSARTGAAAWMRHLRHAGQALKGHPGTGLDGLVTVFPQLALTAGAIKRVRRLDLPLVAWTFNIGTLAPGPRQRLARFAAPALDRIIVHSPTEIAPYARYFGLPEDRFTFVPLHRPEIDIARAEDTENPYILAMGTAQRDYPRLIEALEPHAIRTIIVAGADLAASLPTHPWLEVRSGLDRAECWRLLARARLSVTPVSNLRTASGQVTFVMAMKFGVPVIATRCPGTDGYIEDGRTGILVEPGDTAALRAAIVDLWDDAPARMRLSQTARAEAEARFSYTAAGQRMAEELNRV